MDQLDSFIIRLCEVGGIKVGQWYATRNGPDHPIYVDLRVCMEHPELMKILVDIYREFLTEWLPKFDTVKFDVLCSVPVGSIHVTSLLSQVLNKPAIIPRPIDDKRQFCGVSDLKSLSGKKVCIVEDVITTGKSTQEVEDRLKSLGCKTFPICFVRYYSSRSCMAHSITTAPHIADVLENRRLINKHQANTIRWFFDPILRMVHREELNIIQKARSKL